MEDERQAIEHDPFGRSAVARRDLLGQASKIVTADRNKAYGPPEDNFQRIAELWQVYLRQRFGVPLELAATDVALLMDLMKTARLTYDMTNMDSWLDKAGYTACGWGCVVAGSDAHP